MAGGGAPTIASFTPDVGTAGVPVTIAGTNFEPSVASNKVELGVAMAPLTSSTSTSIGVTVPSFTGSGKIVVTTPGGRGVSSADFFVPPPPYTAADVVFTNRLQFSQALGVTISTAGKIGFRSRAAGRSEAVV